MNKKLVFVSPRVFAAVIALRSWYTEQLPGLFRVDESITMYIGDPVGFSHGFLIARGVPVELAITLTTIIRYDCEYWIDGNDADTEFRTDTTLRDTQYVEG